MPFDASVFDKLHTFEDYRRAEQEFQAKRAAQIQALQTGNIDAQSKANIYATQVLSAAATPSGQDEKGNPIFSPENQAAYENAKNTLQQNGIDVSTWAPDVQSGAQQAQAARLAQSPLGTLFNAQQKVIGNNIQAAGVIGNTNNEYTQAVPSITPTGNISIVPQAVRTQPAQPATTPQPAAKAKMLPIETPANAPPSASDRAKVAGLYDDSAQPSPQPVVLTNQQPARFSFRPQQQGETLAAYKDAQQQAFEAYKADPNVIAAQETAKTKAQKTAELATQTGEQATAASETFERLDKNLDALKKLNKNLPDYGGIVPVSTKARAGLIAGDYGDKGVGYDALTKWDTVNQQQVVNALSELVKGGQIRGNQFIEKIINRGYAVDPNAPRATRDGEIEILRNELKNASTQAQNINAAHTGTGRQEYTATLPQTSTPKLGATMQGTDGVYLFNGGDPADPKSWKKVK